MLCNPASCVNRFDLSLDILHPLGFVFLDEVMVSDIMAAAGRPIPHCPVLKLDARAA